MSNTVNLKFRLEPVDRDRLANLWGPMDDNLKQIERRLGVQIVYHDEIVTVIGELKRAEAVKHLIISLYIDTLPVKGKKSAEITPAQVHLAITHLKVLEADTPENTNPSAIQNEIEGLYATSHAIKTKKGLIKPRSENQDSYINNILNHDVAFGIGPAGTGKTYLAVAAAVDALERQEIRRILLTRPAVEAGEKLGFLPGDLSQKVDPYLRPLYDALFEMLGFERVEKLIERQIIEIAPLAYMRGRTLNDSFIILDEAQNTTTEQMKMLLTRIGFNSKAVITGDITQIDLPRNVKSGLKQAIEVLSEVEEVSFNFFTSTDVVRHPIVAKIVQAYEGFDKKQKLAGNINKAFDRKHPEAELGNEAMEQTVNTASVRNTQNNDSSNTETTDE